MPTTTSPTTKSYRVAYTGENIPGTAQAAASVLRRHGLRIQGFFLGEMIPIFEANAYRALFLVERDAATTAPEEERQFVADLQKDVYEAIAEHYAAIGSGHLSDEQLTLQVRVTPAPPPAGFQFTCQVLATDRIGVLDDLLSVIKDGDNPAGQALNVEGAVALPIQVNGAEESSLLLDLKFSLGYSRHWDDLDEPGRNALAAQINRWAVERIHHLPGVSEVTCKPIRPDLPSECLKRSRSTDESVSTRTP